ncbi:MAG TPA: hypothetical protein VK911_13790 [Vicinamibacterales bacterium]|nr:hypothetical protein [Vicinamibacterales bacterium]
MISVIFRELRGGPAFAVLNGRTGYLGDAMKTTLRLLPVIAVTALLTTAPACVSAYGGPWGAQHNDVARIAYDNGYRHGVDRGLADARARRNNDYRNDRVYRDADRGYNSRYGPRGQYRQQFRSGYEAGYRAGYARYGGNAGGGYGRAVPRDRYGYPDAGARRPDARGGYGDYRYSSPAYDKGHRDGHEKGYKDGRDGKGQDVLRHKWYREGDRDYNSRYGSREQYKAAYRDAFRQGYDQGYREGRFERRR